MTDLKTDTSLYDKIGIKALTDEDIAVRIAKFKKHRRVKKWPEDHAFLPDGITLEQANLKK